MKQGASLLMFSRFERTQLAPSSRSLQGCGTNRTLHLPAPGTLYFSFHPTNPAPGLLPGERAKPLSSTPPRANSGVRGSPGEIPRTCPPARRGAPDPAPAYLPLSLHAGARSISVGAESAGGRTSLGRCAPGAASGRHACC